CCLNAFDDARKELTPIGIACGHVPQVGKIFFRDTYLVTTSVYPGVGERPSRARKSPRTSEIKQVRVRLRRAVRRSNRAQRDSGGRRRTTGDSRSAFARLRHVYSATAGGLRRDAQP